ncbi:hypothetical protein [Reinekea sp.]|uniref:hypothetical protein n=1 Tax=Reinekea sp. TaxID=1970455 RepID=UPI002A82D10C|nr:hypothetical protein [Reinekea sp.]
MPYFDLRAMADTLLNSQLSFDHRCSALDDFAEHCAAISAIRPDRTFSAWAEDSVLASGVAINPAAAAFCIKDYQRTLQFIAGIQAALCDLERSLRSRPIRVLYAGCGPYATLLMPLLANWSAGRIECHLLDIHAQSLLSVQALVADFALGPISLSYHCADATRWQSELRFDLIIAETMQKALEQEPQLAVTAHLSELLEPEGIFIPEQISLNLWAARWDQEQRYSAQQNPEDLPPLVEAFERHFLHCAVQLRADTVQLLQPIADPGALVATVLDLGQFTVADTILAHRFDLIVATTVHVYADFYLHEYDSDLTRSYKFYDCSPLAAGQTFRVYYELGNYPRVRIDRLDGYPR